MVFFKNRVINFVKKIPKGQVVSYGQVAAACGHPRAARQVGAILKRIDAESGVLPWWRVVNNQGIISIKGNPTVSKELQRELLIKEGIKVKKDYSLNMEKYQLKNY